MLGPDAPGAVHSPMIRIVVNCLCALTGAAVAAVSVAQALQEAAMSLALTSPAFAQGKPIPSKYTCDGADVSPPLSWTGVPAKARSLALVMDDPDAPVGVWDHWILFNIPANAPGLPEGVLRSATLADGARQGNNSWPRIGYGGPCPPSGTHRYFFRLYALDAMLDLATGATKAQLEAAMKGHVLAQAALMGTYARKR